MSSDNKRPWGNGMFVNIFKKIFDAKKMYSYILFAGIPAALIYCISLFGLWSQGFSVMEILRDPAQQSGASSFLGFISNIGIWLWISSAAICFFSLLTNETKIDDNGNELLILIAIFSMILAIDDFFLIHDRYIAQEICFFTYAVCALLLLFRHHKKIIEIDGFSFILAGLLLGLSILTDLIQYYLPYPYSYIQVFEEGFKFTGAASWLYFSGRVASFKPNVRDTILE